MRRRVVELSLVGGLALLLAWPAVAHSQLGAPPGPDFGPEWGDGGIPAVGELAPQRTRAQRRPPAGGPRARGSQRFGRQERRGSSSRGSFAGRGGGFGGGRRPGGFGSDRGRGGFGRGRGGFGAGFGLGATRSSLAARALSRADQIGLTAEQTDQINQARRAQREASINRRAAAEIAELELRELMGADTPDIAAVEAKLRELAEQHIAEQTTALRLNASVGEILTSDQLEDLSRGRGRDRGSRRER
ncbi:MAG: hypothetical protein IH849_01125 [Acidobacteria bacterium]|nr:hypothetical protein [Acidobacteriota bacterium]